MNTPRRLTASAAGDGLLTKTNRFADPVAATPPQDWHSEIWLPEPFEPRYHYPLLVWLHDAGETERSAAPWAEGTGMQNMLVLSVRGPRSTRGGQGYDWPDEGHSVWQAVAAELAELPPELRYDANRVVLAGTGRGATAALAAWQTFPAAIAGVCMVNPGLADGRTVFAGPRPAGRLWIGGLGTSSWRTAARAAFALGTDVRMEPSAVDARHVGPALNEWVMRSIPTAVIA